MIHLCLRFTYHCEGGLSGRGALSQKINIERCNTVNEMRFEEVKPRICRYYLNGNCWRQDLCRFVHDVSKKTERQNTPPCRIGKQCIYLARGTCKYFHRNVGVQVPKSSEQFYHKNSIRNSEEHKKSSARSWCKFQEDCKRTPNCAYKHYDEDFPKLPKTNNPPWHNSQSMWEDY